MKAEIFLIFQEYFYESLKQTWEHLKETLKGKPLTFCY